MALNSKYSGQTSAIALALAVSASSAGAAEVTTKRKYYDIVGTTALELANQMNKKGPKSIKYKHSWANADTNDNNIVRMNPCTLRIRAVTTLPRWKNKKQGSPELQKMWDEFMAHITAHEDQHVTNTKNVLPWLKKQGACTTARFKKARAMAQKNDSALDKSVRHDTAFERQVYAEKSGLANTSELVRSAAQESGPKAEMLPQREPPKVMRASKTSMAECIPPTVKGC